VNQIETIELRPGYRISRLIRGGWQLAGGHGIIDPNAAVRDLIAAGEAGIKTFDCADIYTGVETLMGAFRRRYADQHGEEAARAIRIHTKLVPDLAELPTINRTKVQRRIDRSLKRLGLERLDLVQLHWWDYQIEGCIETAHWLNELRNRGKIDLLGGTNFDGDHLGQLLAAGIPFASLQVQYSLLDNRPETSLIASAAQGDVRLFCYGTVAGGFLSDRWLGAAEPSIPLENRSLTKYKLIINEFGGWTMFQSLLTVLRTVADRHASDIATVASRYILDRPGVGAIIVGARNSDHLATNLRIDRLRLSEADRSEIAVALGERKGPRGDVYALERDRAGPHGSIMKYNLGNRDGPIGATGQK
jgi:aryl-alcohol dehydrogenase-like predicted oxidoreductase